MLLKTTSPFPVPFFSVALRKLKMTHLAPVPSGQSMSERTLGTIQPCFLGRGQSGGTGSPHRDGARASRRVWAAEQGGHRDRKEGGTGGCGRGAARGLSAEMLTAAPDGSYASISCYLWDRLAPRLQPPRDLPAPPSTPPTAHVGAPATRTPRRTHTGLRTLTRLRRPALTTGVHAHTHVHSHTQTLTLRCHPPVSLL